MGNGIIIGKRITVGAIIGGVVSTLAWFYNVNHPGEEIPAHVVAQIQTVLVGLSQLLVVNKFGVTTQ